MQKKKPKMLMFVYNDLNQDARVQRSLGVLKDDFDIDIVSTDKECDIDGVENYILYSNSTNGMKKYFDIVTQFKRFIKHKKYQYIYLHDYYSCLPGIFAKGHTQKIIYDAHELLINQKNNQLNKREKFFHFFEKRIVKRCDCVIAAQEKRADMMKEYFGLTESPFVVPNFSELSIDDSFKMNNSLKEFLFNKEKRIFVYAGVMVSGRRIDKLIKETAELSSDYKLLLVGDGPNKNELMKIAQLYPRLECYFTGAIPYKNLGYILEKCDVGFMSYPLTNLNNIYCAPNKIYEYASVDLPMICNDNPTLYDIICHNKIGVVLTDKEEKNCAPTISQALAVILNDYDTYEKNIKEFRKDNSWEKFSITYRNKIINI